MGGGECQSVPEAAALNAAFTKRLVELDEEFEARNADPAHWRARRTLDSNAVWTHPQARELARSQSSSLLEAAQKRVLAAAEAAEAATAAANAAAHAGLCTDFVTAYMRAVAAADVRWASAPALAGMLAEDVTLDQEGRATAGKAAVIRRLERGVETLVKMGGQGEVPTYSLDGPRPVPGAPARQVIECSLARGAQRMLLVILASASQFFSALFAGAGSEMAEAGRCRVALPGVDGPTLRQVVEAVYTASVCLGSVEEAGELVAASSYLQVLPLRDACCGYLRRRLGPATAAPALALALRQGCADLADAAGAYLQSRLPQLLQEPAAAASLGALPPDVLAGLLGSDGLEVESELDVAQAALHWAAADPGPRGGELPQLLAAARTPPSALLAHAGGLGWGRLPPGAAAVLRPAYVRACEALLAEQQLAQPSPPQQQQRAGASACDPAAAPAGAGRYRPRQSTATALLAAGGLDEGWRPLRRAAGAALWEARHQPALTVEVYDPVADAWTLGPSMPAPMQFASGAALGAGAPGTHAAMLVEGAAAAPAVLAWDRHARGWRACPRVATPRVNIAVAGLGGSLYVLGGRAGIGKGARVLRNVECYDPGAAAWHRVADMRALRTSLGAAALGDRRELGGQRAPRPPAMVAAPGEAAVASFTRSGPVLYVVGGQGDRETHASGEWYDPERDEWHQLSVPLAQPRKYHALVPAGGRLLAVGGLTAVRTRLASVEALDPREGVWRPLPPLATPRSSCGVAALGGEVFVVGGHAGGGGGEGGATRSVEALRLAAGAWRECAPIRVGRSGLAAVPGELALRGAQQAQTRVYRGAVHALVTILTQEGPAALGLGPFAASVLAGAAAGVLGAALGTPFQLVKTRMQASAMAGRSYRGLLHALGAVARAEGVVGLWRGVHVAVIKMGIASAVQLSVFDGVRSELIRRQEWFRERPAAAAAAASLAAGLAVTAVINPLDVVTTRLWNQPVVGGRGTLYASAADCLIKTVAAEGPLSLYKGCTAHFLRVGPHTIATLLLLERVQRLMGVPQPAPAP
eukprot:scaffold10.g2395.t1